MIDLNLINKPIKVWAPPPDLKVSEWADAERRLSAEASAEPGRWNTDRAPFQRGIMNAVNEPGVHTIVWKASAQVGKTEVLLNTIGYFIHQDPAPMLIVQPTLDLAEAFSKDRLAPMIRDTPALSGRVRDVRARDSGNTLLHKKFPGGHATLAGANSPASLASRPIRVTLLDEVDRYPFSAGTEGDPVSLAQKRSTTFYNRLSIITSTPTTEGASRIEAEFLESDQRFYNVPCPECLGMQVLKFERFKWETNEAGEPINVRYLCIHCPAEFNDARKDWMLQNGQWIATMPFKGIIGFHIWEAYSPWRRWAEIVSAFLRAKKHTETLRVFVNTALGETWKAKGSAPEWQRLYERRETFERNRVPKGVYFLTAGVDVQKDRLEAEIVGWGRDKQSWSIDHRVILGDTATDAPWRELDKLLNESWTGEHGLQFHIRMLAVDSGFNTQHVYSWARRYPMTRVMAVKGVDTAAVAVGQASTVDVKIDGKRIKRGFRVWPIGVSIIKSELYSWLNLDKPVDGEPYPYGYCHFPEYGDEFFKQLTAEQLVVKIVRGFRKYVWEKTGRNEVLDCRVYARAAASVVGIDRFTDAHWEQFNVSAPVPQRANTQAQGTQASAPGQSVSRPTVPVQAPQKRKSSFW